MKKTLLLIGGLLAFATTNAQVYSASTLAEFSTWSIFDADGDTYNWGLYDLTGAGTAFDAQAECFLSFSYGDPAQGTPGALSPDNYVLSAPIDLSTLTNAELEWKIGTLDAAFAAENYSVYVVTDLSQLATATAVFTETLTAAQAAAIATRTVDISSVAGSATVYLVFRHHAVTDQYAILFDDVKIFNTASINENVITAAVFPNPAKDVLNINASEGIASFNIVTIDGKVVASSTSSSVNVSELTAGIYMYNATTVSGKVATGKFSKN